MGIVIRILVLGSVFLSAACAELYYRHQTETSPFHPTPPLARDAAQQAHLDSRRLKVREFRISYPYKLEPGGWQYYQHVDNASGVTFDIAAVRGDKGALKVQCSNGGKVDREFGIYLHHPAMCGNGIVKARIWNEYREDDSPYYIHRYKSLENAGREAGGGCKVYWVGVARKKGSDLDDWAEALLKTEGPGFFHAMSRSGYSYEIEIDLRGGKGNLARVLERCGM